MSKKPLLSQPADLKWLRDVHGITCQAAMVYGNEDAPTRVDAYSMPEPMIWDTFLRYEPNEDGTLVLQPKAKG